MIQLAGGTNRNDLYTPADANEALDDIKTTLEAAGWTLYSTENAGAVAYYSDQPHDGDTYAIGGKTYRFKNTMAAINDVKIQATAYLTYQSLAHAMNGTGSAGVDWYTGTTANTVYTGEALANGTHFYVEAIAVGPDGNGPLIDGDAKPTHFAYGNAFDGDVVAMCGGYTFKSAATSSGGHQYLLRAFYLSAYNSAVTPRIAFQIASVDEGTTPTFWGLRSLGGTSGYWGQVADNAGTNPIGAGLVYAWGGYLTYRIIANKYQVLFMRTDVGAGASTASNYFVFASCPWVPDFLRPGTVTGATNASPIVITQTTHGLSTSDQVVIRQVGGNTAANGLHTITYVDANHYSLDGTAGNGAYTSGGIAGKADTQIVEAAILTASKHSTATASTPFLRLRMDGSAGNTMVLLNATFSQDEASTYSAGLSLLLPTASATINTNKAWFCGAFLACDPVLQVYDLVNADTRVIGQLWDIAIGRKQDTLGNTGTFLGENWYNLTDNSITPWAASALIVVP